MNLKKGMIPLYHQLEAILRKRILSGEVGSENFFTEQQLCNEFGVSRITVRQALDILEGENLVKRQQGRGTFAVMKRTTNTSFNVYGYVEDLLSIAKNTRLKLTTKSLVEADPQIAEDMGINRGDEVYLFEGIRYLLDQDYNAYFQSYVPKDIGEKIPLKDLGEPVFFMEIERTSSETAKRATQITSATVATQKIASIMDVEIGHPLLVVKRIYTTRRDKVLEVAISYFPGDKHHFKINLERTVG